MDKDKDASEDADIPTNNDLGSGESAHAGDPPVFQDTKAEASVDTVEKVKPQEFVYGILIRSGEFVQDYSWNNIRLKVGEPCIVENENGRHFGTAARARRPAFPSSCCKKSLRKIARKATPKDIENAESLTVKEKKAMAFCRESILERDLPMSLSKVQYAFDGKKATFFFTADGRVDFRELVKDLVNHLRIKIEMRQIGVRDEARMLGGCGPCGVELCCSTFLNDFAPISIRMAKDQNLSLNPTKISGVCGRLMCCLGYEHKNYKELQKKSPKLGKSVVTPDGLIGRVCQINLLQENATVVFEDDSKEDFNTWDLTPLHLADKSQIKQEQPQKRVARERNDQNDRTARRKTAPVRRQDVSRPAQKVDNNKQKQNKEKIQGKISTGKADDAESNDTTSPRSKRRRRRRRGKGRGPAPKAEGS